MNAPARRAPPDLDHDLDAAATGGARRIERRAAPQRDDGVQLCAFRVGEGEYAIDVRRVREILPPLPTVPIPGAPEFVQGIVQLRGTPVPVVDVRKRLRVAPSSSRPKLLVVEIAGRVVGLLVDGVLEVQRVARSAIGPAPTLVTGAAASVVVGVCGANEPRRAHAGRSRVARAPSQSAARLRLLLDVKALLGPPGPSAAPQPLALVVDDSAASRGRVARALLEGAGMRVIEARHGAEGWLKLQTTPVDLVVTDLNMPVMDGLKLVERVRSHEALRTTPIVVVTSERSESEKRRALELGANACLAKPVEPGELASLASSLVTFRA